MSFNIEHAEFFFLKGPVINDGPKTEVIVKMQQRFVGLSFGLQMQERSTHSTYGRDVSR